MSPRKMNGARAWRGGGEHGLRGRSRCAQSPGGNEFWPSLGPWVQNPDGCGALRGLRWDPERNMPVHPRSPVLLSSCPSIRPFLSWGQGSHLPSPGGNLWGLQEWPWPYHQEAPGRLREWVKPPRTGRDRVLTNGTGRVLAWEPGRWSSQVIQCHPSLLSAQGGAVIVGQAALVCVSIWDWPASVKEFWLYAGRLCDLGQDTQRLWASVSCKRI
jgi:hypothetical protein